MKKQFLSDTRLTGLPKDISRRQMLHGAGAMTAGAVFAPLLSAQASRGQKAPRFLLVMLRGGMDGLSAVMPVGDPDFARHRAAFIEDSLKAGRPLPLDRDFALAPQLNTLEQLFNNGQATIFHALASPYRQRSHFDAQDMLESGLPKSGAARSGWLNRALAHMPGKAPGAMETAVAIGQRIPLVLTGKQPVISWSPQKLPLANIDTIDRLQALYDSRDPLLAKALSRGVALDEETMDTQTSRSVLRKTRLGARRKRMLQMANGAAKLLARPHGPQVGVLLLEGWDTHAAQRPGSGRMHHLFGGLDEFIETISRGLQPVWQETAVLVVSEFGRTVRINGSNGTDHGTAGAGFLFGGAVRGGRVRADWPGLAQQALYQGRDLRPTMDMRSIFKGLLADHLSISHHHLDNDIFPGSAHIRPLEGLV